MVTVTSLVDRQRMDPLPADEGNRDKQASLTDIAGPGKSRSLMQLALVTIVVVLCALTVVAYAIDTKHVPRETELERRRVLRELARRDEAGR